MNTHTIIIAYLMLTNIIAFALYGIDKHKARRGKWRIPEHTLLVIAAIGGSVGAWCGMKIWHHKTIHLKFRYGVPAIFISQIVLTLYIITSE